MEINIYHKTLAHELRLIIRAIKIVDLVKQFLITPASNYTAVTKNRVQITRGYDFTNSGSDLTQVPRHPC